MDSVGASRVRNVLRKRSNEQEGYKWRDSADQTVGIATFFRRARGRSQTAPLGINMEGAPSALTVSSPLWTPKKAEALFAEVQIHLVCSRRCRASQSHAAYQVVPASASRSLLRSRKPRRPAGRPGGSVSSVLGAAPPRCRHAGGRQDGARFSAG